MPLWRQDCALSNQTRSKEALAFASLKCGRSLLKALAKHVTTTSKLSPDLEQAIHSQTLFDAPAPIRSRVIIHGVSQRGISVSGRHKGGREDHWNRRDGHHYSAWTVCAQDTSNIQGHRGRWSTCDKREVNS